MPVVSSVEDNARLLGSAVLTSLSQAHVIHNAVPKLDSAGRQKRPSGHSAISDSVWSFVYFQLLRSLSLTFVVRLVKPSFVAQLSNTAPKTVS